MTLGGGRSGDCQSVNMASMVVTWWIVVLLCSAVIVDKMEQKKMNARDPLSASWQRSP